jgi:hypothetical protein
MASSLNNPAWLEWMTIVMDESLPTRATRSGAKRGGPSRHTYAATFPPGLFYCLLDELPLHLLPRRIFKSLYVHDDQHCPLYLNPDCILSAGGQLPEELASCKARLSGFALQGTIAWVRNLASGDLLPFWLGPPLEAMLHSLRPHEPAPSSLPRGIRRLLAAAGILVSEDRSHTDLNRDKRMARAAYLFREKGYAPLGDLIHPFHIAALRRYYRYLIRSGLVKLGDGQSPRRYAAYNEPVARFFHHDIAATLSTVAGEPLKPSYVYMASYLSGAQLKKHTDREQCEFSVTLCVDFSPEPALETPWPIRLDTSTDKVTVYQALGDGLAYRGTRVPHYRDALADGQTSTSIFFHYVAADFSGSLD